MDFAFAGPQSLRVSQLLEDGQLEIGAIHTYVELYARLLVSVDGFGKTWKLVLDRFFSRYQYAASFEIHDFGATPGAVALRLEQAVERSQA